MYKIDFIDEWDRHFKKFDKNIQQIIIKKIEKQTEGTKTRHLKLGIDFYVVELGQYRIAIKIEEEKRIKEIWFVGNHKQYEKWYKSFF